MTRATQVAVTSPGIDPMAMWRAMATFLNAPEHYRFTISTSGIHADLGQGLDALMSLDFAPDGALIPEKGCDEYCADDCERMWCRPPTHYLMADFDTAYGATDPCGCHSGGIHIRLVSQLGAWLAERGATWEWWDESGDGWNHDSSWGTLGDHREACEKHRSIPAPTRVFPSATGQGATA